MPTVRIGLNAADDFTGVDDAEIHEGNPTGNAATNNGFEITKFGSGDWRSVLIKFGGLSNISGPVTVSAASINIYWLGGNSVAQVISAYPLLRNWVPAQVTWNNFATASGWGTPGAQSGTDRSAAVASAPADGGYKSWTGASMAALVEAWINGSQANYGVLLERSDGANDGLYTQWRSSEDSIDTERPYLEVTYTEGGGGGGSIAAIANYYRRMRTQ
jgi:hypothetical protein